MISGVYFFGSPGRTRFYKSQLCITPITIQYFNNLRRLQLISIHAIFDCFVLKCWENVGKVLGIDYFRI